MDEKVIKHKIKNILEFSETADLSAPYRALPPMHEAWLENKATRLTDYLLSLFEEKEKEIGELKKGKGRTYCAFCGEEFLIDAPDATTAVSEHIQTCKKHPLVNRIEELMVSCDIFETLHKQAEKRIKQLTEEIENARIEAGYWRQRWEDR